MPRDASSAPLGALVLLCWLCLAAPASADVAVVLSPERAGIGKPFLVRFISWFPMEDLEVTWNGRTVRPAVTTRDGLSEAMLLLGVGLRGETGTYPLEATMRVWGREQRLLREVAVVESVWQRETLSVPPKMVKPPASEQTRIQLEGELMRKARNTVSSERWWSPAFTRPVEGPMLSRFGLHRVFNGATKGRHTGLDFRAWLGTPIRAMAAGRVVLTGHFYYPGNVVFIDHGNGLVSMSCHLSKVRVREGDRVEAGQVIGLSGATGRVTGAHLHLAVFVLGAVVDPEVLFQNGFGNLPE